MNAGGGLAGLVEPEAGGVVRLVRSQCGGGVELRDEALANDWEGLIVKDPASRYLSGRRHPGWRKLKFVRRQEFVVGGVDRGPVVAPRVRRAAGGLLSRPPARRRPADLRGARRVRVQRGGP